MTKLIKRVKDYSYRERLEKLQLTILLKKLKGDLTETFKIIDGISIYGKHFFSISPWTGNLLSRQISKTKSIYQMNFFFAKGVTYFWNKLRNQIKNINSVKKNLRLNWMISEIMLRKRIYDGTLQNLIFFHF